MGKYNIYKPNEYYSEKPTVFETQKIKQLNNIANELAELNRLKRIEIEQGITQSLKLQEAIILSLGGRFTVDEDWTEGVKSFKKSLEDQA